MTKTVASIDFYEHHLTRPLYGGVFHVPAVKPGEKPFLLEVKDHIQLEKLPHVMGGGQIPRQILGEHIAADIVEHWTSGAIGMTPECCPGVWIVRDTIPLVDENGAVVKDSMGQPQSRPATAEEKAQMWAEDHALAIEKMARWGDYCIQQGEILDADPEKKKAILIGPVMRAAAVYYKRPVAWVDRKISANDRKVCPFCIQAIDSRVVKCPNCGEVVDHEQYAALGGGGKAPIPPPLRPNEPKKSVAA